MEGFHPSGPVGPDNIAELDPESWPEYRKKVPVRAIRVAGPFSVVYRSAQGDTTVNCDDGYLAVDARGYPYQIHTDEFERIYEPVEAPAPS